MDISRLHRVLKIITMLQTRRHYGPGELAQELDVSKRTIYRDLNMLELAGIPFYYDRAKGGYTIHETYWLPPVNLSVEEALSLVALAEDCAGSDAVPLLSTAADAARKIESRLPLGIRAAVGHMSKRIAVRHSPTARHAGLEDTYALVRKAAADHRTIRSRYISFAEGKQIRVTIDPYWLVFHERAWYVIGRSREHGEIRTFKLGRFASVELSGKRFKVPKTTLDDYLGNAWRFIPEGRQYTVRLRFAPMVAANVAEVRWHRTQKVDWQDDGSMIFEVRVDGLGEIAWWILGYGDKVEVLEPKTLRTRVQRTAKAMAAMYD
jgi:predicted DNA-binding transcriptional regulator YafY